MNEDYYPFESMVQYDEALTALQTDQDFHSPPDAEYFAMQDPNHKHYTERLMLVLEVSQS